MTTKVKKNARSCPMVKVWTVPRSQLAWAIRHIEKNHSVRLADSKGRIAVIEINMGTDADKQFKLLGGGRFHSNFRWTHFFFKVYELTTATQLRPQALLQRRPCARHRGHVEHPRRQRPVKILWPKTAGHSLVYSLFERISEKITPRAPESS